jgi:hypothetical protein
MKRSRASCRPTQKRWPMPSNETDDELTRSEEAPKSAESGLEPQQEDQKNNLVYDFLYHDARRIASFLAQFETYGVLQQVKATESVGHVGTSKTTIAANAGVPLVAKGAAALAGTVTDEERDAAERTYDPLWTNARTLRDYLTERGMIVREIEKARIGQFVQVTGELAAFDLGLLKQAWKLPAIKESVLTAAAKQSAAQLPPPKNKAERAKARYAKQELPEGLEAGFELMSIMPHTIQASIRGQNWTVWASLREDSLVTSGSELLLKHGVGIAGTWNMLGILDALPHQGDVLTATYVTEQILAGLSMGGLVSQVLGSLGPMARMMLGRPSDAFGMTPLLIFREVSG